ncbi:hypothetical protein GEMRC1_011222 [Eukaryota sp. GEM-RC1]
MITYSPSSVSELIEIQRSILCKLASLSVSFPSAYSKLYVRLEKSLLLFDKNISTLDKLTQQITELSTKCFSVRSKLVSNFPDSVDFPIDDDALPCDRYQFGLSEDLE